jgi:hypothetical protein
MMCQYPSLLQLQFSRLLRAYLRNSCKIIGIIFEISIDTGIPNVARTCLGYRENTNPSMKITITPVHDCSLLMLSDASTARYTIIATNGSRYATTFKNLKQKEQVF